MTGSFGSGKTTVAKMFARMGAFIIDADEIAHQSIEPGKPSWKKIVSSFGNGILRRDRYIDRRKLGEKVFSDRRRLKKLCDIIHPFVYKEIGSKISALRKAEPSAIVMLDVPLLFESGGEKRVDKVIVVKAPLTRQVERAKARFGLGRKDIMRRIRAQMPLSKKIRSADFVIDNSGSIIETGKQARAVWKKLVGV